MRGLSVLIISLFLGGTPMAQPLFSVTSSMESGWTSNATESAGGAPDFHLRHTHDLSAKGNAGPLGLRAGILLEQQVFRVHTGENDLSVTAGLEAELALGEGVSLRTGYAITQEWTGKMVDLGPLFLTLRSPVTEHELLGEINVAGDGRAVSMGLDVLLRRPGLSEFESPPLPPARIDPDVTQVIARMDGEWVMTPDVSGLARLHWIAAHVPDADRVLFDREPASVARMAAGLRLRTGILTAEFRAGLDTAWPQAASHLLRSWPYLDARMELALTDRLVLTGRGLSEVDVLDPIDNVASGVMEMDLGAKYALSDALALSLGLALRREQGIYDERALTTRQTIRGALAMPLAPGLELSLLASHARITETGLAYSVSKIGLVLAGRV